MNPDPPPGVPCPRCGQGLVGRPKACPHCGSLLIGSWWKIPKRRVPWRYDLASIMVLVLIVAVGLGLSLHLSTAGFGVPLLILGPATILRATPILIKRRREGWTGDLDSKAGIYFESCFVAGLLLVAGSIAFTAVCFPIGLLTFEFGPSPYFWIALVGGGLAACLVFYFLGRRIFPPKD